MWVGYKQKEDMKFGRENGGGENWKGGTWGDK